MKKRICVAVIGIVAVVSAITAVVCLFSNGDFSRHMILFMEN